MKTLLKIILPILLLFGFSFATDYIYFHGNWCPHCAKVDEFFATNKIYDKVKIEKREVYFDNKNRNDLLNYFSQLKVPEADQWVPFLIIKDWENISYVNWDGPIVEKFSDYDSSKWSSEKVSNWDSTGSSFWYIIGWIVLLIIIWWWVFYANKTGKINLKFILKK